jgi:hypothetical protein
MLLSISLFARDCFTFNDRNCILDALCGIRPTIFVVSIPPKSEAGSSSWLLHRQERF